MRYLTLIGDVHGCFQTLLRLLEKVPPANNSRLVFMGDLINKGPASYELFEWARNQEIEFLLGNHEYMCIHRMRGKFVKSWPQGGGEETVQSIKRNFKVHDKGRIQVILAQMSYFFINHGERFIEIPTAYGKTILLTHAGVSKKLYSFCKNDLLRALTFNLDDPKSILFNKDELAELPNIIQVIGHQPKEFAPRKEAGNYFLDSGCVYKHRKGMGYLSALVFDLETNTEPLVFRQRNID